MLIMDPQEHVLIISPDERIQAAYSAALRDITGITHSFTFIDPDLASNVTGESVQRREQKEAIRAELQRVKPVAQEIGISHATRYIEPATIDAVASAVLAIHDDHPSARYSFVLSGNPAPVSIGLFRMAMWLSGDAYFVSRKAVLQKLTVPMMTAGDFAANPNYLKMLMLLHGKPPVKAGAPSGIPRQVLFKGMKDEYAPLRAVGGKKAHRELTHGNFSQFLATLIERGLVAENFSQGDKKIRLYSITPEGEIALRLHLARPL
ncbi:MAG: hypothetical protein A4E35_00040 [Methanoregula sp. PtaU1.Bin051]|nr:MAG: hypothetical protein A4E35_00040 [Methanoregula sp. PtaU1.Bin051]